ncbi:hypothetical protein [Prosthecochloris sp. SCSIO W1103]|uniref:hypothetical protein n=1 Tax=Prosthecochloris sp. SCSIO W1103 TaxID=2992244 RepID=UPI00223E09EC|nr:hypothetical protein [Prosthecochloris sp. SCSIO W1103]UZJ37479.1 hypothetical protein OO005_12150 [Prosthecochloris sp. SCSIO W1103]
MSRILWSRALVPGHDTVAQPFSNEYYGNLLTIPRTKALAIEERKAPLPDRKVHRSMSRAGVLLSVACLEGREVMQPFLDNSPFGIGIYCAIENGPVDLDSTSAMLDVSREDFAEQYRKFRNPKMFLKQVTNLAPAQMGIFLGIMGPLNVYNNSMYGSLHALEQAEIDLEEGKVKAALVCSAFSFEDPLVLERIHRNELHERILCEGAGACLLISDGTYSDWDDLDYVGTESYYGISHQIVMQTLIKGDT